MKAKLKPVRAKTADNPIFSRLHAIIILLMIVGTLGVYWQCHTFEFVRYDDGDYVLNNPNISSGLTPEAVKWAFSFDGYAANWHPLTWISHMTDVSLYGLAPGGHHVTSVAIHILSAILLFLALSKMTGAVWRSAFVAALFAIHPMHVESVAWVSERKDVLSTFFLMATLISYTFYTERPNGKRYLATLGLFVLGLMAKPMLVTLPIVLLLLDWWPLERASRGWKRLVVEKLPYFALVAASSAITMFVQHKGGAVQALATYPLSVRIDNALVAYASYIGKTIWPVNLAVFYPHPGISIPILKIIASAAVLAAISAGSVCLSRRRPYVGMGWLMFLVMLVPVIGIVQVGWQGMADRYTYVPVIGLFIAVTWGLADLADKLSSKVRTAAVTVPAIVVLAALLPTTHVQVASWKTNETLFRHALDSNMNNRLAAINLGCQFAEMGRYDEAAEMLGRAVKVYPLDSYQQCNYANALLETGQPGEAKKHYREAIKIRKDSDLAYSGLGRALYVSGDIKGARLACLEAIRLNSENPHAHNNYGMVLGKSGDIAGANKEFEAAIRIKPDFPEAYTNIGVLFVLQGRYDEAVGYYEKALQYNPKFVQAHNRLAEALYNTGDYARSWEEVHRVRELGGSPHPALIVELDKRIPDPAPRAAGER